MSANARERYKKPKGRYPMNAYATMRWVSYAISACRKIGSSSSAIGLSVRGQDAKPSRAYTVNAPNGNHSSWKLLSATVGFESFGASQVNDIRCRFWKNFGPPS